MRGAEHLSGLDRFFRAAVLWLLHEADRRGLAPVVTEGWRSKARQAKLFRQGRTTPGPIVTRARPGQSAHQYGLAADITSTYGYESRQARAIHALAKELGFGTVAAGDDPHMEHPQWRQVARPYRAEV